MASKFQKLAASTNATQAELWEIAQRDSEYAEIVARNTAANSELLRKIYFKLSDEISPIYAACAVLINPNADCEFIEELFKNTPNIFEDQDIDYPEQTSFAVLLSKHQHASFEMIEALSRSTSYMVREKLAARFNLPVVVAEELAQDESRHVREILASNQHVSDRVLKILWSDIEPSVRLKVALNPVTSSAVLLLLLEDADETVKFAAETQSVASAE